MIWGLPIEGEGEGEGLAPLDGSTVPASHTAVSLPTASPRGGCSDSQEVGALTPKRWVL